MPAAGGRRAAGMTLVELLAVAARLHEQARDSCQRVPGGEMDGRSRPGFDPKQSVKRYPVAEARDDYGGNMGSGMWLS
jgi:hypothetical protein